MRFWLEMLWLLAVVCVLVCVGFAEGGGAARDLAELLEQMGVA